MEKVVFSPEEIGCISQMAFHAIASLSHESLWEPTDEESREERRILDLCISIRAKIEASK